SCQHRSGVGQEAQPSLRASTLADVTYECTEDVVIGDRHRRDRQLDRDLAAAPMQSFDLDPLVQEGPIAGADEFRQTASVPIAVAFGYDRRRQRSIQHLLTWPAEQRLGLLVPFDHATVLVDADDGVGGALDDRA